MQKRFWIMMMLTLLLAACVGTNTGSSEVAEGFAELPAGNAENGATLFARSAEGAPPCGSCHVIEGDPINGPALAGYGETAATRVEGQTAEQYTYTSIVKPAAHIVSGYANIMYPLYGDRYSPQQIADLIAYLLTL
jgi:mono/diheme cytochrome c family protein